MKAKKSNYKAAADYTRRCRTLAALARRERSNQRLYQNGCLTVSQYARLASIEMDMAIKLENNTKKKTMDKIERKRRARVNRMIDARNEDKSRTMIFYSITFFILSNAIGLYMASR